MVKYSHNDVFTNVHISMLPYSYIMQMIGNYNEQLGLANVKHTNLEPQ